jgi:lipid-A-disaccharide synthase
MDKEVVKELIQDELNTKNLKLELNKILNFESRALLLNNYAELKQKLGGEGASKKTADLIVNSFRK